MNADERMVDQLSKSQRRRRAIWLTIVSIAATVLGVAYWSLQPAADTSEVDDFLHRFKGGALVIGGGGTLPNEVRQRFVDLIGGRQAKLVVIPAYDADQIQVARITDYWREFGAAEVQVVQARDQADANRPEFIKPLEQATGVWLTGGDQAWYAARYVGTHVEDALKKLLERGGSIGGTSAGAAIMSQVMIEHGIEKATVSQGFDLIPKAIIDQHFMHRSRLNRLMGVMENYPEHIGFGIDEDTALVMQVHTGKLGVLGRSYVLAYVPQTETGEKRYEFLKHGDSINIEGLRSGEIRVGSQQELDDLFE